MPLLVKTPRWRPASASLPSALSTTGSGGTETRLRRGCGRWQRDVLATERGSRHCKEVFSRLTAGSGGVSDRPLRGRGLPEGASRARCLSTLPPLRFPGPRHSRRSRRRTMGPKGPSASGRRTMERLPTDEGTPGPGTRPGPLAWASSPAAPTARTGSTSRCWSSRAVRSRRAFTRSSSVTSRRQGLAEVWQRVLARVLGYQPIRGHPLRLAAPQACGRNTKLASRPATAEELAVKPEEKIKVLAETRGHGGFVVCAPTPGALPCKRPSVGRQWLAGGRHHPSRRGSVRESWPVLRKCNKVPAGALHERPERARHETIAGPPSRHAAPRCLPLWTRPGDVYNQCAARAGPRSWSRTGGGSPRLAPTT